MGTFPWFTPKFVKPALNAGEQMRAALGQWRKSVETPGHGADGSQSS
jgi:hypothetical protein